MTCEVIKIEGDLLTCGSAASCAFSDQRAIQRVIEDIIDEKLAAVLRRPPTAVDNMNPKNPALQILKTIPVTPRIKAHSIIAVESGGPKEEGDDGVMVYRSAYVDEAVSELSVRSDHSC